MNNLEMSSHRLAGVLSSADTSKIIANAEMTTQLLMETSDNLKSLSVNLINQANEMKLPEYVRKMYSLYDSSLLQTNQAIGRVSYRAENSIFTLQETLDELRKSSKALQNSLKAISDNPSAVFFSEPPPREK